MGEVTDYQYIRKHTIKLGKEEKVKKRAIQLQYQLSEPGAVVPYKDAFEMAYNEIIVEGTHTHF